jgi:hypothetical protein
VNPSLYQINTKALLSEVGGASLDDIPDSLLDKLAKDRFDWVWLLGVWTLGLAGATVSRSNPAWVKEFTQALPDLTPTDICGSPFAVWDYTVDPSLGGDHGLSRFRERLAQRGLKLLLDFVPNHVALDHPWVETHSHFFIQGTPEHLKANPERWFEHPSGAIFAYGRDPNFPGWPDTLQLNYFNPELRQAVRSELRRVAGKCDGVRCDMAMLLEPEVFNKTWGNVDLHNPPLQTSFWAEAIGEVREAFPEFVFVAEVYWNYEHRLQQQGFDYTYDKTLYDRLLGFQPTSVVDHLSSDESYQHRMCRFLENHDEPRIAAQLSIEQHRAAAALSFLAPGMRLLHHGQLTGKRIKIPIHLRRGPSEKVDDRIAGMYCELIQLINSVISKEGRWQLLKTVPAWDGNQTHRNFICYLLTHDTGHLLLAVNYAHDRGQSYIRLPALDLPERVYLRDTLSTKTYVRDGLQLTTQGLYLDVEGFTTHAFLIERL